jgi:glycosyltransferase involved in cell wall biosynthesis
VSRIAVLWEHLTGYTQAALEALLQAGPTRLFVVQRSIEDHARFAPFLRDRCEVISLGADRSATADWLDRLEAFAPELAIVTATKDAGFRRAARRLHARGAIVVWASDVPPRPLWRDLYGVVRSRTGFCRGYDVAFVSGQKAAEYARRIGFPRNRVFTGLYTCDTRLFRTVGLERHASGASEEWPRRFLFVGQFITRKGLDILIDAYRQYRKGTTDPWELWCAGTGPLRSLLDGVEGVRVMGFLTPDECAAAMGRAGALVLPSRIDHWGVVIHEATCAGLPVIASRNCFAAVDLVQDGINGFIFPSGDVPRLAHLLADCASHGRARAMGQESLRLSYRADPDLFAATVLDFIPAALGPRPNPVRAADAERDTK